MHDACVPSGCLGWEDRAPRALPLLHDCGTLRLRSESGRKRMRQIAFALLVLSGVLALDGCSATQPSTRAGSAGETGSALVGRSQRVLVLPLRDGSCLPIYGNHVMCHVTGEHLDAGRVPEGAGANLGAILSDELEKRGVSLVPYDRAMTLFSAADPGAVDRYEPELAIDLARQAGADKALMGVVARYEERSGSRFGSREPAAVAFSLALVDIAKGEVTYRTRFNRRQAPLTTNLLALPLWWREGVGWWSREQVARQAMSEAADALVGRPREGARWTSMPEGPPPRDRGEWRMQPAPSP